MRPTSRDDFVIAIICALPMEAEAVDALFDETYDRLSKFYRKLPGDANSYVNGKIGEHNVVLCYMPGMGKGSAASVASSLLVSYPGIQLALVVGICGGAPSPSHDRQIFLGDVIISNAVVEYDFGKQYPSGFQRKSDVKETLGRPDRKIRALLIGLDATKTRKEFQDQMLCYLHQLQQSETRWQRPDLDDILFEASYLHKHYGQSSSAQCCCVGSDLPHDICEEALGKICHDLGCDQNKVIRRRERTKTVTASVHIGTVASADTVMKSAEHRDEIVKDEGVFGFEMEGAGVWDNVSCIIIKGVCDYADSHKNKAWQAYAAATGASAAKAFLEYWDPILREDRPRRWMVPFARNSRFVGRTHDITKIERWIMQPIGPSRVALCGLGGIGKTQIALELAYRIRDRDPERSIFWIPCTSYESVEQAYMNIAQLVGIDGVKSAEVKNQVRAYFSQKSSGKWLLIFDNADDIDMWIQGSNTGPVLNESLPQSEQGHILFTSRNQKLAVKLASSHVVKISEPDKATGVKMLETLLMENHRPVDEYTATTFLEHVAFLPLAIAQAAAYINENSIGISSYITLLEAQELEVIELLSEKFEDKGRYRDYQNPVATTWWISFQQIQRLNQQAAEYLSFMACINPRNIPRFLLPQSVSEKKKTDAIGLLKAYSLISEQAEDHSLNLHRLVHCATRNWMRQNNLLHSWIRKTVDRVDEIFPSNYHTNRALWRTCLPHALSLIGDIEFQNDKEKYFSFLHRVGECLYSDGRYYEAEAIFRDVMDIQQIKNGETHDSTLTAMSNLASTYRNQGRLKEAKELDMQVMKTTKKVLGTEHPDTLTSMANLASTYWGQGRLEEAEKLEVQVTETRKRILGTEHPSTLTSMANLASIYRDQGRWKEAEELNVQVIETEKRVLGTEHPSTLTSMANLASIYQDQGRWKEAKELDMQLMKARKRVLGLEHPDTLASMNNLASTYQSQGRWKEAEKLQAKELEICFQVLGTEHPNTLTSMSNLASTYRNQGRWKEAEELQAKELEICSQVLGIEHPNTLISMNNLASTYWNQGRWKEAEELEVQVMDIRKRVLGIKHPNTLISMSNLAHSWKSLGRYKDAVLLMADCVKLSTQHLGSNHPHTISSTAALNEWQAMDDTSSTKSSETPSEPEREEQSPNVSKKFSAPMSPTSQPNN